MSKIGNYNMELQEVANELGYSTVQEAIAAGNTEEDLLYQVLGKDHARWAEETDLALEEVDKMNPTGILKKVAELLREAKELA